MVSSFIITFREALEAALIIGIILSFFARTNQTKYNNIIYLGVVSGVVGSLIGAFLFNHIAGGFSGRAEKILEKYRKVSFRNESRWTIPASGLFSSL